MTRDDIVARIFRELTTELPVMFQFLPDVAVWRAMIESVLADDEIDVFAEKFSAIAGHDPRSAAFRRDAYAVLRGIVNEWQNAVYFDRAVKDPPRAFLGV